MNFIRKVLAASKLSVAQARALKGIVEKWNAANEYEKKRWGKELEWSSSWREVEPKIAVPTLHKLKSFGLVELAFSHQQAEKLDKGPWGRWRGGTKLTPYVDITLRPTAKGIEEAAKL